MSFDKTKSVRIFGRKCVPRVSCCEHEAFETERDLKMLMMMENVFKIEVSGEKSEEVGGIFASLDELMQVQRKLS